MAAALENEELSVPCQVSILLVENDEIRCINQAFRDKDSVTDVLSFPMLEMQDGKFLEEPGDMDMAEGQLFLGDIVVSVPKAMEQAEAYGHSVDRELAFLTLHGFLHLLGYDHEEVGREKIMTGQQEKVLSALGLFRA